MDQTKKAVYYVGRIIKAMYSIKQRRDYYHYRGPDLDTSEFPEHGATIRKTLAKPLLESPLHLILIKFWQLAFQAGYNHALANLMDEKTIAEPTGTSALAQLVAMYPNNLDQK